MQRCLEAIDLAKLRRLNGRNLEMELLRQDTISHSIARCLSLLWPLMEDQQRQELIQPLSRRQRAIRHHTRRHRRRSQPTTRNNRPCQPLNPSSNTIPASQPSRTCRPA